jgi:tyrosyl-tRNA synthetase
MDITIKPKLDNRFHIVDGVIAPKKVDPFKALKQAAAAAAAAMSSGGAGDGSGPMLKKSELSLDDRYNICRMIGEECIQEDELRKLLEVKDHPVAYDGFEPSGRMHIAQGIMKAINVNRLTKAGCLVKIWVADWFAMLNNKMGGDLKKIKKVGEYMIEVWKAAGMDMDNVQFLWASEEINKNPDDYWGRVMDIATKNNLKRIIRCCTAMGREESDDLSAAQIFYPCMQCADIFYLKADICQLGMDQRKVNMLAREYCDQVKPRIKHKPVILSHHMLMGLKEGQAKMSKSDPDTAIFMEDTAADVGRKIKKAFCPEGVVKDNPVLDWTKYVVFGARDVVPVTFKSGETKEYTSYEELEADYASGVLHPSDLKPAVTAVINSLLEPVRQHFKKGAPRDLLDTIKRYKSTR